MQLNEQYRSKGRGLEETHSVIMLTARCDSSAWLKAAPHRTQRQSATSDCTLTRGKLRQRQQVSCDTVRSGYQACTNQLWLT